MIWKNPATIAQLNQSIADTAASALGIEFTDIGTDSMTARMPVDSRTVQPMRILHGGASVLLAETLGSTACYYTLDKKTQYCVGLDINANHVRSARSGWVTAVARPVHLGRSTQAWEIHITNEENQLVCISRITMAVLTLQK
ncbi:MAG: hotdog fold thioesterase [Candidatus Protistobacter heckmanni]|nr:hotdog fold thioesterase [Candidatus Protistobacter heckmanni]